MKILIFSDCHWSTNTSIVRTRSSKYSTRLSLLIKSLNWVNELAIKEGCAAMVCAGDFFDKSQATDEELTALRDIIWNNLPCYFLCGNHESSVADLRFSSLKALESENHFIISRPTTWKYNIDENEIRLLPYIVESDRKPLNEYFHKGLGKTIIISHNDIAGINYGGFESKIGFSIDEIEENCDLYLNGHLHNSEWISKKILNVGSTSAHNFTNDSSKYAYGAWILDTDNLQINFIENPYSLNFYKVEINSQEDLLKISKIKENAVISVKCNEQYLDLCKEHLESIGALDYRITTIHNIVTENNEAISELQGTDHIQRLIQFCHEKIDNTDILNKELAEICK